MKLVYRFIYNQMILYNTHQYPHLLTFLNKVFFGKIKIYVFVKSHIFSYYSKCIYIFAVFFELYAINIFDQQVTIR